MTIRLSDRARNAAADGVVDELDVGDGTATLQLWSGARPGAIGGAPSGDLLAEFELPDPVFGGATAGVATANAIEPTEGVAADDVGFARARDQDGTVIWDNDSVGTEAPAQLVLNTTSISVGVAVEVLSWTVTMPASAS